MLTRINYHLQTGQGESLSWHSASLFQGALMEKLDPLYGEVLHRSELKPYSQYLDVKREQATWVLQTLTEEAAQQMIDGVHLSENDTLFLEHSGTAVKITAIEKEQLSYDELLQHTFFAKCARTVKLHFVTPTAFKVQGQYQMYPTVQHIFKSLIQKHNACAQTEIAQPGLIEDLQRFVSVIGYQLQSTSFSVEGVRIPSFVGTLLLKISGPQQLVNLVHLLLRFGTYSGVGIKTAMGMGALRLIERKERMS